MELAEGIFSESFRTPVVGSRVPLMAGRVGFTEDQVATAALSHRPTPIGPPEQTRSFTAVAWCSRPASTCA